VKTQWIQNLYQLISHLIRCYDMFSIIQILLNSQISSRVDCVSSALSQLQLILLAISFCYLVEFFFEEVGENMIFSQ
jgi:hypothetical protein